MCDVIEIRELTDDEAKREVLQFFRSTKIDVYYLDIVESLAIDLEQVVRVCEELAEDGLIEFGLEV